MTFATIVKPPAGAGVAPNLTDYEAARTADFWERARRLPGLYVAALGTLKNGSVFSPLFSAFGPEPVRTRLALGGARVLVTTEALYRRKIEALREALPQLAHVVGG